MQRRSDSKLRHIPLTLLPSLLARKGVTLAELLIVIGLVAILGTTALINLYGRRSGSEIGATTQKIATLLREAQSRAVAGEKGEEWGVHFNNSVTTRPFYALFYGTYAPHTVVGYYSLPGGIAYASSSIAPGSTKEVRFSVGSGVASASTSITIVLTAQSASSSTISVASSGAVKY